MAIDLKTPPELDEMPAGDVRDDTLLVAWDEASGRLKRVRRDAIAAGGGEPAGEFVREINTVPPFDDWGLPDKRVVAGIGDGGNLEIAYYGEYDDDDGWFDEVYSFKAGAFYSLVNLKVSAFDASRNATEETSSLEIMYEGGPIRIMASCEEGARQQEVSLSALTIPDLDDPQYEDFIGMTPKLTKALVNAPTPQITTAVNLTLTAAHNGALVVCTDAVTITASSLPSGFECLVLATNGDVEIAGAFLYEGGNDTISIDGSAAKVMNLDGIGAWVSGCDS